ncbi:hypothetical protein BFF78_01480 [Streptomyces fodineus]|uniref:Uncharacterized protein n=2 Tax=Streptomyces fodineus TaxID=1904616 RepID=A0A1D7Y2Z7_9ACTN|nr:hypothetical protein BFF78_01480 [Streptomyces fodineus]
MANGPVEEAGVFAGQTLTVLVATCDLEASQSACRLDDGREVTASWHVHELLAPPYPPDRRSVAPAHMTSPGAETAPPRVTLEVVEAGRRYCLAVEPAIEGRAEVTVLVCSADGVIQGELTGELPLADLGAMGRLITAAAAASADSAAATAASSTARASPAAGAAGAADGGRAVRPGAAWTPEDEERLCRLHQSGKEVAELAGELGRSENAIRWKLYSLKLAPYPADLVPAPRHSASVQAQAAQPKAYTVAEKRQSHPRAYERWSPEEDERLARMHADEVPVAEMARELGRNEGAIASRLEKILPPF